VIHEKVRIIRPARVTLILSVITVALIMLSTAGQIIKYEMGHNYLFGFVHKFYLDRENNIPTYFSTMLLLLCSCLLAVIASAKKHNSDRFVFQWKLLAVIFLLLSVDEAASMHEILNVPLRKGLHAGSIFHFSWVIIGIPLVFVVVLSYLKFVLNLPLKTRILFIVAALLYLVGALGMELVGGHYSDLHGREDLTYSMLTTIEETLELAGLVLFIHALMTYIGRHVEMIGFRFGESRGDLSPRL